MQTTKPSIAALNHLNCEFWDGEQVEMIRRLDDQLISEVAIGTLTRELFKNVSTRDRSSYEQALAEAEKKIGQVKTKAVSELGRKGGLEKKQDALQNLIVSIVGGRPTITVSQLLHELELLSDAFGPIVGEIDKTYIHFQKSDCAEGKARLSGLKHRLSRAKKEILSR